MVWYSGSHSRKGFQRGLISVNFRGAAVYMVVVVHLYNTCIDTSGNNILASSIIVRK